MNNSPYANPQPYDTPELERSAIEGRITVAKKIRDRALVEGNTGSATRWQSNVDALLDKLAHVEDRAASAALDLALREET
jgi:hypothetical protein